MPVWLAPAIMAGASLAAKWWESRQADKAREEQARLAKQGAAGYGQIGGLLTQDAEYLRRIARGEESVSAEQLRQALQQNMAAQQSMAAGASPQNSTMAALMASRNNMQLGSGLAGQQAVAGIQERQAAMQALVNAQLQQRGQDLQAAQGGVAPPTNWSDGIAGAAMGAAQLYGMGKQTQGQGQSQRQGPAPQYRTGKPY